MRSRSPIAALVLASWMAGCSVNPATGKRELTLVGEGQEVSMGRDYDAQLTASLGLVPDTALQAYVESLGRRLAAASERPGLPWTFRVVDDPAVNAFALPGGFVYVTRGILARFDSEAELVGVLGHEIGHVTARHSVTQMSRQQLQQLGLGLGMVLSEEVQRYGDLLATGLGLLNLRYSRGDETESDELGVRYMGRAGYDPTAMVGVFQMLSAVSGGASGRAPEWTLTHPHPENREAHIRSVIAAAAFAPSQDPGRDRYLDRIQGLTYGENPREGYFRGSLFLHPELAFQLRFPAGWKTVNQRAAVAAVAPGEQALVVLELVDGAPEPAAALSAFLREEGRTGGAIRETASDGIRAARAAFTSAGPEGREVRGEALFARHGAATYRVVAMASADAWAGVRDVCASALDSFARLTDPAVLAVRPWTLEVVTLREAMTVEEFHRRYPAPLPVGEVAVLNRRDPRETVPAGTRLKRVVGRPLP